MGKKGGKWFGAVKKVFAPAAVPSNDQQQQQQKAQKKSRSKKKWGFGMCTNPNADSSSSSSPSVHSPGKKPGGFGAGDDGRRAYSVALASAVAARAAAEVARLTKSSARFTGMSEDAAAVKIQTAFRGFLARRALRAMRGLARLQALSNSPAVKRQAAATLRCMQTMARVQAQIRSRRIRMLEENQALQRQLQMKHERELEKQRMAEEWNASCKSKEQMDASLQQKQEAAMRRERTLAYAFAHQWKSSSRAANPTFMDPNNSQWGWSWMERWMASRPWEGQSPANRDRDIDRASVKSASRSVASSKLGRPASRGSPSTPVPRAPSTTGKGRTSVSSRSGWSQTGDDSNRVISESLGSTTSVPTYLEIAKGGKSWSQSSARKRLSFPPPAATPSPATAVRRHSVAHKAEGRRSSLV